MFISRSRLAVVATLALMLSVGAGATDAAATGPKVVAGWKDGPLSVPTSSSLAQLAALKVPAGRWVAWAKLFVDNNTTTAAVDVACTLRTNLRGANVHRGRVTLTPVLDLLAAPAQPLALASYGTFGSSGGKFILRCAANGGAGMIQAHWIKIMAMRVGTLTIVNLATGSVSTSGTGLPKVVIGSYSGPIPPSGKCAPDSCHAWWISRGIWLGSGAWWVRASLTIDSPDSDASCRLEVGQTKWLGDEALDEAAVTSQERSVVPVVDAPLVSMSGTFAGSSCDATDDYSAPSPWAGDVRITAIKLGTLVTWPADTAVTYGTGWPIVNFKTAGLQALPDGQWSTVGSVPVRTGKWMFLAKAQLGGDGPTTCQLLASPDYDQSEIGAGEFASLTLPFAVVHAFAAPGTATLRCNDSGSTSVSQVHLAALKLLSFENTPLP